VYNIESDGCSMESDQEGKIGAYLDALESLSRGVGGQCRGPLFDKSMAITRPPL
jgi:hypothetical protein